jgi:asparagine synthase (glutamine-hydrolysing)
MAHDVKDVRTRDIFKEILFRRGAELTRPEDYINHSLNFEAKTFLHGLLVVEDKLSMAHSLESRVPFLDNDLVDFAMNCPVSLKVGNPTASSSSDRVAGEKRRMNFAKNTQGKAILRSAMQLHIPSKVSRFAKQGFSGPDASWFQGQSSNFVRRQLVERDSKLYEFLDKGTVEDLLSQHFSGETNRRLLVWSLLNLDSYMEQMF